MASLATVTRKAREAPNQEAAERIIAEAFRARWNAGYDTGFTDAIHQAELEA